MSFERHLVSLIIRLRCVDRCAIGISCQSQGCKKAAQCCLRRRTALGYIVTKRNTVPSLGERLSRSEARVGQDGFLGPSRLRAAADDVHGKQ